MENRFLLSRRNVVLAATLFTTSFIFAQDVLWEKSYGGRNAEYLMDVVPTADYGFILAGSSLSDKSGNKTSIGQGDLDYWVWKMDEKGDMEWQKSFGGSGTDFLQSIKLTNDGGFILAGTSDSPKGTQKRDDSHGGNDFWVIKLNAGGGEEWQKTIGGSGDEKLNCVFQTKDGGYILGGSSSSDKSFEKKTDSFGNFDYWVVKISRDGKLEWEKSFGGKYFDELRGMEQTMDGGYIVGGYSNSPQSGNKKDDNIGVGDYWILKLDKTGETQWEKVVGGDKDDQLYTVHQCYDGGYLLGGNSNSQANYSKSKGNGKGIDFWIIKLDEYGERLWQETYDFGTSDILTSIVENRDHTLLVGGFAKSEPNTAKDEKGINDYIAMKLSDKGEVLWSKTVGSDGDDDLRKLIETRDGGYLLAGTSTPMRENVASTLKKGKLSKALPIGSLKGQPSQNIKNAADDLNNKFSQGTNSVNEVYDETMSSGTNKLNKSLDTGDSPLKIGFEKPASPLSKSPSIGPSSTGGDALTALMDKVGKGKDKLPASRDKKDNFGNKDFWVVKLKDKMKNDYGQVKSLEAMPNPTSGFTNVIVNYEYTTGRATLVDIAGHILKQFEISGRTVPVDLSGYPAGMYIVNIKTNVQSDGVKVIKNDNNKIEYQQ